MITKIEDFDIMKINIHDPYEVSDNIIKIDLSIDKMKPIMLRLEDLHVLSFTPDNIILDLREKDKLKKLFDNIDSHIVSIIQERKITKRLKTKFNYRQFTSNYTNKDTSYEILSLGVDFKSDIFSTEIYEKSKKKLNEKDATVLLKNNARAEIVLELTSVVFNKTESIIYLENIVRQMKIKKIKPKRVEKLNYLFIDSESDNNLSDNELDNSDNKPDNCNNKPNKKYLSSELENQSENIRKLKTDDNCLINNSDRDDDDFNNDGNVDEDEDDEDEEDDDYDNLNIDNNTSSVSDD